MSAQTAAERRSAFWSAFIAPDVVYPNDPADGHEHQYLHVSPRSLGAFGPMCVACVQCGWVRDWGEPQ